MSRGTLNGELLNLQMRGKMRRMTVDEIPTASAYLKRKESERRERYDRNTFVMFALVIGAMVATFGAMMP